MEVMTASGNVFYGHLEPSSSRYLHHSLYYTAQAGYYCARYLLYLIIGLRIHEMYSPQH